MSYMTASEMRDEIVAYLREEANRLETEAHAESLKGAANTSLIGAYNWGATLINEMAGIVSRISDEVHDEFDDEEPPAVADPNRPAPDPNYPPNPIIELDLVAGTVDELDNPNVPVPVIGTPFVPNFDGNATVPSYQSYHPFTVPGNSAMPITVTAGDHLVTAS